MATKNGWLSGFVCFTSLLLWCAEARGESFVPPVSGPIKYSCFPVDDGTGFNEEIPQTWYSMVWSGRYSDSANIRYKGTGGHPGADIRDRYGRQSVDFGIYAIGDGVVIRKRCARGWGNFIVIRHDGVLGYGSVYSIYAHLASFEDRIKKGQEGQINVERGEKIGTMYSVPFV